MQGGREREKVEPMINCVHAFGSVRAHMYTFVGWSVGVNGVNMNLIAYGAKGKLTQRNTHLFQQPAMAARANRHTFPHHADAAAVEWRKYKNLQISYIYIYVYMYGCVYVYIYIYIYICVCVCTCVVE